LEAAYNYHLRQVAEFESMYGAPIKFDSLDAVRSYNPIYVQKHQKRLHSAVNLRSILIWMIGTIFISALVFWAISLLWIAQDGLYKENLQVMLNASYMALAYVLIGLVLLGLIALRLRPSRNIQRAKKKEA
jgi:hypothetical protein